MSDEAPGSRDVFISYSSKNKKWADAACAMLESQGIRCWIAPRDIIHGSEWGASIIGGIEACKVMVLIFSAEANASIQVRREVERALSKGLILLPFRIENVSPEGALEYALSSTQWFDGFTPPLDRKLEELAESVEALIGGSRSNKPKVVRKGPEGSLTERPWIIAGIFAVGLAIIAAAYLLASGYLPRQAVSGPTDNPIVGTETPKRTTQREPGLVKGVRVKVTEESIGAYTDVGAERLKYVAKAGWTAEIIEAPKSGVRCLVRFDLHPDHDVWIERKALEVE
jgi:TIR domain